MAGDEKPEVFRGHIEECLKHLSRSIYARVPKGSREISEARRPIAEFCGVGPQTVTSWLNSPPTIPVGEPLIRLLFFLDMTGYRVIELERLPKGRRNFAELIAFGLISMSEAGELAGYSNTSTLSQVLQGRQGTGEDKEERMRNVWKERREELAKKKEQALEQYRLDLPKVASLRPEPRLPTPMPVPVRSSSNRSTATVSIAETLLILLDETPLDELTEAELASWQPALNTVLQLMARLSALSSRLIAKDQPKGGS